MNRLAHGPLAFPLLATLPLCFAHAAVAQNVKSADEIACALAGRAASDCGGVRGGISVAPRPTPADPPPGVVSLDISFEINSDRLRPDASAQLDELATALANPALTSLSVEIVGHTDSSGDANYNLVLSRKRAEAVQSYLLSSKGIDPARLDPVGRGEDEPIPGMDPASPQNRRVEIRLNKGSAP